MKKIILILAIFMAVACEERNPELFGDMAGIYFNNRAAGNALVDSVAVTFVYTAGDGMTVPVKIQLLGRPVDFDREVSLTVSSENALIGEDYLLPEAAVLPAGATIFEYPVEVLRTEALKSEEKIVNLEIHANDNFTLPVKEIRQASGTVTTLKYRIHFSDMFTEPPVAWEDEILGGFTQHKFEFICRVLNVNPADFNDSSKMTLAKQFYIVKEMTEYINDELDKRAAGQPYDEDIIDRETGETVNFKQ